MSRPRRLEFPVAVYHVTSRGDRREAIYRDDGVYTQRFNHRHGLVGRLFQGRYKAILVDRDAYLLALCRYVERAGLETCPRRTWDRRHRPHGWTATACTAILLGRAVTSAADRRRAAALYAQMLAESSDADLWQQGLRQQVFLGDEAFVGRMLGEQAARHGSPTRVDGIPRRQTRRPASLDRLLGQHGDRDQAIVHAYRDAGFTMIAIARQLGLSVSRVSRIISMAEARGKTWPLPPVLRPRPAGFFLSSRHFATRHEGLDQCYEPDSVTLPEPYTHLTQPHQEESCAGGCR